MTRLSSTAQSDPAPNRTASSNAWLGAEAVIEGEDGDDGQQVADLHRDRTPGAGVHGAEHPERSGEGGGQHAGLAEDAEQEDGKGAEQGEGEQRRDTAANGAAGIAQAG